MLTPLLLSVLALPPLLDGDPHLRIDAFGYRPDAAKVVVLREPVVGYDAPAAYTPPAQVEIRRADDDALVATAPVVAWRGGAVDPTSGDRVWHADFSDLRAEGTYYALDPASGRTTETFEIRRDPYREVRRAALRMFYYQRCGVPKAIPYAEAAWADGACHVGALQDTDCRFVLDPTVASSRDLRGGWHDAGDYNKYVNLTERPIHDLLSAYAQSPSDWDDASGLPESGNGVPDILDEARFGLEWMLRMQEPDGSLLHKVGVSGYGAASPPSADAGQRFHAPPTSSATIAGAGVFAHGAVVFGTLGDAGSQAFATTLRDAALAAWGWHLANPDAFPSSYDNAGFLNVAAEDDPLTQTLDRGRAALWLYVLTGDPAHRAVLDADVYQTDLLSSSFALLYRRDLLEAFLSYAEVPGATAGVVDDLLDAYAFTVGGYQMLAPVLADADPYRAHLPAGDYTWGSNRNKADVGVLLALLNEYGLAAESAGTILDAVEGYARYLHGVNPTGLTYLSHLDALGAPSSIRELYHAWFADGTAFDNADTSAFGPAPGYLAGGPNVYFAPEPEYGGPPLVPPMNQPEGKSYRDWNADWPEASWQVTEPQIAYQSSYLRLLSFLGPGGPASLGLAFDAPVAGASVDLRVESARPGEPLVLLFALGEDGFELDLPALKLDLGLTLAAPVDAQIVGAGLADASGRLALSSTVPPALAGTSIVLQAVSLDAPDEARQSAVRRAVVRP